MLHSYGCENTYRFAVFVDEEKVKEPKPFTIFEDNEPLPSDTAEAGAPAHRKLVAFTPVHDDIENQPPISTAAKGVAASTEPTPTEGMCASEQPMLTEGFTASGQPIVGERMVTDGQLDLHDTVCAGSV